MSCSLLAAPAPVYKPKPVPVLSEGRYVLLWTDMEWNVTLKQLGHNYTCERFGTTYLGSWHWEAKTRTAYFMEHREGSPENTFSWQVVLDKDLKGVADYDGISVQTKLPVSFKRVQR